MDWMKAQLELVQQEYRAQERKLDKLYNSTAANFSDKALNSILDDLDATDERLN